MKMKTLNLSEQRDKNNNQGDEEPRSPIIFLKMCRVVCVKWQLRALIFCDNFVNQERKLHFYKLLHWILTRQILSQCFAVDL